MKTTTSLTETHLLASGFANTLVKTPSEKSIVVGLYGDLGSGKTSFVQGLAAAFGVNTPVASPTFVLEKIYKLDPAIQERFSHLVHIDAYRMDSPEEVLHIGLSEILKDPKNVVCVEWPEKIASKMPEDHIHVVCGFVDEDTRTFDISFTD